MIAWEYKTIRIDAGGVISTRVDPGMIDATLHKLGAQGWELVTMLFIEAEVRKSSFIGIMKRPVRPTGSREWNEGRGTCPSCSYDLRAVEHPVCPECGWSIS